MSDEQKLDIATVRFSLSRCIGGHLENDISVLAHILRYMKMVLERSSQYLVPIYNEQSREIRFTR